MQVTSNPLADLDAAAPALRAYTEGVVMGNLCKRTDLSPRDRSLVTVTALVVGGHTMQVPFHLDRALDNGVSPSEIAEVITHLAFYSGWPNAMSAAGVARDVFALRGIDAGALSRAGEPLTPDASSERARSASVEQAPGTVAPALGEYTNNVLFGDV